MAKPDKEEVWAKYLHLRDTVYASAQTEIRKDEEYYLGKITGFVLPDRKDPLIPPLAKDMVDTPMNRLNLKFPTFEVAGDNQVLRNFAIGIYQTFIPQIRQAGQYMFGLGAGDMLILALAETPFGAVQRRRGETDGEFEARQEAIWSAKGIRSPFYIRSPHTANLFYDLSPVSPTCVFERQQRLTYDVAREYKGWQAPDSEMVDFVTYFDHEWFGYFAGDQPLLKGIFQKHGYGFIPYTRRYSGYGTENFDRNPAYMIQGVLRAARDVIYGNARTLNQALTLQDHLAWNQPIRKTDNPSAEPLEIDPTKIINIGTNEETGFLFPPVDVSALLQTSAMLSGIAYEYGAPSSLRGATPSGPGYKLALSQSAGGSKYEYTYSQIEELAARVIMQAAALLKNGRVKSPLTLRGEFPDKDGRVKQQEMIFKAEDLEPPFYIKVTFESASPEEQERKALLGMQAAGLGPTPSPNPAISANAARKDFMGRDDPEKDAADIRREQLIGGVAMVQWAQGETLKRVQQRQQEDDFEQVLKGKAKEMPSRPIVDPNAPPPMQVAGQPPISPPFMGQGVQGQTGAMQTMAPGGPFQMPPPPGSMGELQRRMAANVPG